MSEQGDYTFMLEAGQKRRYIAGSYNPKTMLPKYELTINIWNHIKGKVDCDNILLGDKDNCSWACDLHNKSTWPAYIIVKKDGELLKN